MCTCSRYPTAKLGEAFEEQAADLNRHLSLPFGMRKRERVGGERWGDLVERGIRYIEDLPSHLHGCSIKGRFFRQNLTRFRRHCAHSNT